MIPGRMPQRNNRCPGRATGDGEAIVRGGRIEHDQSLREIESELLRRRFGVRPARYCRIQQSYRWRESLTQLEDFVGRIGFAVSVEGCDTDAENGGVTGRNPGRNNKRAFASGTKDAKSLAVGRD